MPRKKPGYSFEQHDNLGKDLQSMRDKLLSISVDLSKAYPVKAKVSNLASRASYAIDTLRNELDSLIFREHTGKVKSDILKKTYYRAGRDDSSNK